MVDGNQTFNIITAAANSADSDYSGLDPADVAVTNNDDDVAATLLPDTGQTTLYTATFGEDSDYTINPPSYTNNGDGTVTDNVTGLMWQQEDDNNIYNWYEASGGATDVCGSLTLGSYSDWRLPDIEVLTDILDLEVYSPAIDTVNFPNTNSSYYWSSTTYALSSSGAWRVGFNYGNVYYYSKSDYSYVRCVRGGQGSMAKSFTDNGNGTVTDNDTTLIWQQGEGGYMTWESALTYCEGLSLGDNSDWRLPNHKELKSLIDYTRYSPALDTTYFPDVISSYYWSSTTYANYSSNAWGVYFYYGYVDGYRSKSAYRYVRCVRGGQ